METEKMVIAALAVGVFACVLANDHYSITIFKEHAQILKPIKDGLSIERLIDKMLDLQPGGLTNLEEALEKDLEELEKF